jgi:uncharacterized protein
MVRDTRDASPDVEAGAVLEGLGEMRRGDGLAAGEIGDGARLQAAEDACYTGFMAFEWDPRKAASNLSKHGVSFTEAASVFSDPLSLTFDDPDHSSAEERFIIIGTSESGRLLIVAHIDRDEVIRIISARLTTGAERKIYESGD